MKLEGQVAIVTGAGQGIGFAYAQALVHEGAGVVIAEVDERAARAAAEKLQRQGCKAIAVPTDVANEKSVANMVEQTLSAFGRIDILINNAALFVALFPGKPFLETTVEEWDRVMAVNVRGTFLCCKAVIPSMQAQGGGSIVNISSGVYYGGLPKWVHYTTSKSAIVGMTRALAKEFGSSGIRVNTVTPGFTVSEGVEQKYAAERIDHYASLRCLPRRQTPEDLVGTILYLASADSAFITGQIINVDGGMTMH